MSETEIRETAETAEEKTETMEEYVAELEA